MIEISREDAIKDSDRIKFENANEQLVKDGKLDPPLSHPNKIRKSGDDISSSFYGDE